jgi:integrating conjugative element protein (TIGR03749 family)
MIVFWLVGLLLTGASLTASATEPPERVAWRKMPIALELRVGTERLVQFPNAVKVGVPAPLQDALRIQSIAGTVYLLAHQPFASTRVLVRGLDGGGVYLLDLSATVESAAAAPIEIFDPDEALEPGTVAAQPTGLREYGYVSLTRFAAQQLYTPSRLLEDLPGVVRVSVKRDPLALVRGDTIEAVPLIAWRAGDLFVTAVQLTNQTDQPQILDPRTLRGAWLTATFQHNRLLGPGDEADRTVAYLISARPFASSL